MFSNPLYRTTGKYIVYFLLTIAACRLTHDFFALVIVGAGIAAALANKPGRALIFYMFLPFLGLINPMIFPRSSVYMIITRMGGIAMTFSLLLAAQHRGGNEKLPLGMLGVYVLVSLISSASGYAPLISYLKLFTFTLFLVAIYVGTKNLHHYAGELFELRAAFFAFCCVVVFGSLLVLPFPSIAYFTSLSGWIRHEGVEEAVSFYQTNQQGLNLFSGFLNHSQTLAVVLSCCTAWIFADMVVVERRLGRVHLALLACAPIIAYMTRSRLALLTFAVAFTVMALYCFPHMKIGVILRGRIRTFMGIGCLLMLGVMVVMQVRNQAFSRWIRKTNDVSGDARTALEAFTATRMGAIEMGLYDFRKNPLFGMGFQVAFYTPDAVKQGWAKWYSAPVEKSLLPMIVLGESGIMGVLAFCLFLLTFYTVCGRKRYFVTNSLFTVFLTTNLGEGTFFSTNGIGGVIWILTVVGGFLIDLTAKGKVQRALLVPVMIEEGETPVNDVLVIDEWERRHSR